MSLRAAIVIPKVELFLVVGIAGIFSASSVTCKFGFTKENSPVFRFCENASEEGDGGFASFPGLPFAIGAAADKETGMGDVSTLEEAKLGFEKENSPVFRF